MGRKVNANVEVFVEPCRPVYYGLSTRRQIQELSLRKAVFKPVCWFLNNDFWESIEHASKPGAKIVSDAGYLFYLP